MASTPSRAGQVNGSGDADALFLKIFSGEVLTAFAETNVFDALHTTRNITEGKSATFPVFGKATASYHTVGNEIKGQVIKGNERVIHVDSLLIAPVEIPSIDEAMSSWDYRSIYTTELGRALARKYDQQLAQVAILAARASATVTGGDGGSVIKDTNLASTTASTKADALYGAIMLAAQKLDEKDVPDEDRYCVLRPAEYYALMNSDKPMNRDYGGSGNVATGEVPVIGGIRLIKSNHVPNSVISADSGANNTYNGDFSDTKGVVFHTSTMGTVQLMSLALDMQYEPRYQSTFTVAKFAVGHGILRPESSVELSAEDDSGT